VIITFVIALVRLMSKNEPSHAAVTDYNKYNPPSMETPSEGIA
jgi:hypothetical protein